ncbi:MAG: tRNA pseudouridine(38-40) synthase TruA [Paludibacteraceae bacterium]
MRYFICFSYCGSGYQGSQSQPDAPTVQGELERALALILRQPVPVLMAGRTDAGVHAEEMWAHIDLPDNLRTDNLVFRLNGVLPADIAMRRIVPVQDNAHARFDALFRTYEYRITTQKDPFHTNTRTRVRKGLDFQKMNQAATYLIGKQDFQSFSRTKTDVKTFFCTITQAYWRIEKTDSEGNVLEATFTITANRFLRNMVRAVVGTLFETGYGKRPPEDMQTIIAARDRCAAGESAHANGLFLTHIAYPLSIFLPINTN